MVKLHTVVAGASAAGLIMLASQPAFGGIGASGCDDLSGIAQSPMVDFQSQIQPIFDDCASCHGEAGAAGLDLRAGESYDNLVGVISTTNSSRLRVDAFNPDTSALLLAVSCDSPGGPGFRMPGTTLEERALIRDWIALGAPATPPEPVSVPVGGLGTLITLVALLMLLARLELRQNGSVRGKP